MLKKRFFLSLVVFSFFIVIFNFSLVSASLEGASKIRMLSLSVILSVFEIIFAVFIFYTFLKSATNFSNREKRLSLILNSINDGIVVHNVFNEVLFLNSVAEEILGIKFKDMAGIHLSKELSLRNSKFEKIVEVLFFSKLSLRGTENFIIENKESQADKFFIKIIKIENVAQSTINGAEFVTTAAHQLRTPLSGVKWVLKMLLENPGFNSDQIFLLKKGQETNEKIIKIVNDLLDTTKIESGKFSYSFKSINSNLFVEGLILNFSPWINKKNIQLVFEKSSSTLPDIKADPDKLEMVLGNLIDNAIKYTPEKGGIKISLVRKNNFAEFSVADTGIGIPETERAKVFSKFFRAGNAAKADAGGAGLGLFIAYRIVSDHGGQMRFVPNFPQGSIFSFTIPFNNKY